LLFPFFPQVLNHHTSQQDGVLLVEAHRLDAPLVDQLFERIVT